MKCLIFLFSFLLSTLSIAQIPKDQILELPGLGKLTDLQYAGFLPISEKPKQGQLFYWLDKKKNSDAKTPLILWLNGGPGAASLYGFFMENGPFYVNEQGGLSPRTKGLNQIADYLVIDQPAGVGYSQGNPKSYQNEAQAIDQLFYALQQLFKTYPELSHKDFYLAGESYAGKYLPQLASRLMENNNPYHLQGMILGDPWINPKLQQQANIDYAYYHGLIDADDRQQVQALYQICAEEIDKKSPSSRLANKACSKIQEFITERAGGLNLVNIYTGKEVDDKPMVKYLNREDVRLALHIPKHAPKFATFSELAADMLEIGEQDSVMPICNELLKKGLRILIYNGLEDGKDCNFLSTNLLFNDLSWPGKKKFSQAPTNVWKLNGQVAGYAKESKLLTQVKIRGAGHLAPIDQPERVMDIFKHFINEENLCPKDA
jgi:carboxypeptidase C (cathepsin A)